MRAQGRHICYVAGDNSGGERGEFGKGFLKKMVPELNLK